MVLVMGGFSSLGLIATNTSRHFLITKECNIISFYSFTIEIPTYIIVNLLRMFFFVQFAWDYEFKSIIKLCNCRENKFFKGENCKNCFWILLVLVCICGAALPATLGYFRDEEFASCINEEKLDKKIKVSIAHAVCKAFTYFSVLMICFCSVRILYYAKHKWQKGTRNQSDCIKIIELEEKLYSLYNSYIEVGKKTSLQRNALRRWFALMYLAYLIFVLIQLVHIAKTISTGMHEKTLDIASAIANIVLHFFAFFFPYYMGISLNNAHHAYHKGMINTYFGTIIDIGQARYECKPGNYCVKIPPEGKEARERDKEKAKDKEARHKEARDKEKAEEKYREFFKKALSVQISVIVAKKDEFDLVPSVCGISIPFDSPGYTLALLLTVFSMILNFIQ